jgi:hypothetical protein
VDKPCASALADTASRAELEAVPLKTHSSHVSSIGVLLRCSLMDPTEEKQDKCKMM